MGTTTVGAHLVVGFSTSIGSGTATCIGTIDYSLGSIMRTLVGTSITPSHELAIQSTKR